MLAHQPRQPLWPLPQVAVVQVQGAQAAHIADVGSMAQCVEIQQQFLGMDHGLEGRGQGLVEGNGIAAQVQYIQP
ncbi:hypothetical protein D3C79_659920 [compost metagenome]